ncbi:ImmA/IrrE family metallo-endopeptidase [Actinokineospora terrae]|uniref:Zn-dependent peptidase ImmA, M78 family n=1 Tax=Actinokineospora terrae TaxID=155974 RepID=A0A1H9PF28_9PSEU|nr:XRE family transcriptional regulator [Actinokineospora terrae]SER46737.1 Zn-dependent peptidase ImmA, M78 family [Actinokineospora terrae]
MPREPFDPPRLTMARRLAGNGVGELSERVGADVEAFELGQVHPGADVQRELARALDVPVAFFQPGRPRLHLDLARTSLPRGAEQTAAAVELLWEVLCEVRQHVDLPVARFGPPTFPTALARRVRAAWGVDAGPLPNLIGHLEDQGVLVALVPQTSCAADLPGNTVIGVVATMSLVERRWAVAEQFGHLLSGSGHASATAFAAELLMPADALACAGRDPVEVAARFGVPVDRLTRRARALGIRLRTVAGDGGVAEDSGVADGGAADAPEALLEATRMAFADPVPELAAALRVRPRAIAGLLGVVPATVGRHLTAVR